MTTALVFKSEGILIVSDVVKWLSSDMQGAPQVTNAWGVLVSMLDACLINGFNTQTATSVTRSGSTVTMTFSGGGHGFVQHQVILVAGAVESDYNGEHRVTAVTGTTVTFTITGTPTSPATGLITAKTAPLGFEKPFSGTDKAVYRSANLSSTRMYLRVDNSLAAGWDSTYAKFAKVTMSDAMSDVDTFTGSQAPYDSSAPTKNHVLSGSGSGAYNGWAKWYYARQIGGIDAAVPTAGNRKWLLIGDDKGFYLSIAWQPTPTDNRAFYTFGDFYSLSSSEAYNCILQTRLSYQPANSGTDGLAVYSQNELFSLDKSSAIILKPASGVGSFVYAGGRTLSYAGTQISGVQAAPQITAPNSTDNNNLFSPTFIVETSGQNSTTINTIRGKLRGAYWCLLRRTYADFEIVSIDSKQYMAVTYYYTNSTNYGMVLIDITGAW